MSHCFDDDAIRICKPSSSVRQVKILGRTSPSIIGQGERAEPTTISGLFLCEIMAGQQENWAMFTSNSSTDCLAHALQSIARQIGGKPKEEKTKQMKLIKINVDVPYIFLHYFILPNAAFLFELTEISRNNGNFKNVRAKFR